MAAREKRLETSQNILSNIWGSRNLYKGYRPTLKASVGWRGPGLGTACIHGNKPIWQRVFSLILKCQSIIRTFTATSLTLMFEDHTFRIHPGSLIIGIWKTKASEIN